MNAKNWYRRHREFSRHDELPRRRQVIEKKLIVRSKNGFCLFVAQLSATLIRYTLQPDRHSSVARKCCLGVAYRHRHRGYLPVAVTDQSPTAGVAGTAGSAYDCPPLPEWPGCSGGGGDGQATKWSSIQRSRSTERAVGRSTKSHVNVRRISCWQAGVGRRTINHFMSRLFCSSTMHFVPCTCARADNPRAGWAPRLGPSVGL